MTIPSHAAFCYAVALAVRKLDEGNFRGLNSKTFLVQVEGQLEEGIKALDPDQRDAARRLGRTLLAEVRSLLALHEADRTRFPKPYLAWDSEDPSE